MFTRQSVQYGEMECILGPLTLLKTDKGLCRIDFGTAEDNLPLIKAWLKKQLITAELELQQESMEPYIVQLEEYFARQRTVFDIPLDLFGTRFQKQVWDGLMHIPYGETYSYKDIATLIGSPKAVRAIGSANNKNPMPIIIPCHRVIGSNGCLVGYGGGLDKKEVLLNLEQQPSQICS
ncbi:methylated-DNA--[protein]-cysteine S-methyltransferase [Alkalihalobacillus sp. AL-G]|uniref:methylated-DNA--[protein]-cysteine S-methyltransferase n=1 Tax=Alkalihalobacillus sp. AL-G TaxID=2926399 RepID=UPI00272D76FE|nr:methylated-DNA--[protein]-cysteine S-methyltransferase [Alkalihalobacillus sp. AL-G]WLD94007.1 methylated-DNA--[protein]-cysteine S-methyltransferase [Alkalihalobacillus sp. AL-G]